jgi:hypothetical protein
MPQAAYLLHSFYDIFGIKYHQIMAQMPQNAVF